MRGLIVSSRVLATLLLFGLSTPASASNTIVRTFNFSPDDVSIRSAGDVFTSLKMEGATPWGDPGTPEVPAYSVLIDIPQGYRAVGVVARATQLVPLASGIRPMPAQEPATSARKFQWADADPASYASQDWSYGQIAELGISGFMRGRALASVILFPMQVSPARGDVRLATQIEVTLEIEPASDVLERQRIVPEWERVFDRAFASLISHGPQAIGQGIDRGRRWETAPAAVREDSKDRIGTRPFAPTALPSTQGSPVQYLIITSEELAPHFDTLATWKTEKGVPAIVRTVEFIDANFPFGVDRAERIRMFIRDAYLQWGITYVLLAGDTPIIPVRYGRTTFFGGEFIASDLYYSDVDRTWNADGDSLFGEGFLDMSNMGDDVDLLPDVYVGRAPVETPFEASIFISKVLTWEKNPAPNYVTEGLFFAEVMFPQDWSEGMAISLDGADIAEDAVLRTEGLINPTRMYENWMPKDTLGAVELTRLAVIDSINQGFGYYYHGGHGFRNSMSVGDGPLTNSDITPLTNNPRTAGMIYSINCTSAAIDFESIGEEWVLAAGGGAASNIGSTHFDFPTTGHAYQNQFFNIIFRDSTRILGAALAMSKIPFTGFAVFDNVHRWTQFTLILLGDPEMNMWTVEPDTFSVEVPASISLADTSVTVFVSFDGVPLVGAKVCLLKDGEDYRVVTTDTFGNADISFRGQTTGNARLTITAANKIPEQFDVPVVSASGSVVLIAKSSDIMVIDSGSGAIGNNNGVLDAGETINLFLPVTNVGDLASGAVDATLLSLTNGVTIVDDTTAYGVIGVSATIIGSPYQVMVDADSLSTDGDEAELRLVLTDGLGGEWHQDLQLTVRAPSLKKFAHALTDVGPGNGDDFLDIGETGDYVVTLINLTEGDAKEVTGILRSYDSGLTVLDSTAAFGSILGDGQGVGDAFQIQNVSSADPQMTLFIFDAYGVRDTLELDFVAPDPPSSVKGTGSASSIALAWTKSDSLDLEGYFIFRSLDEFGPFAKVNQIPSGRTAYFLDGGLGPLMRYYYYITAVDSSGNESAFSATISASTNPPTLSGFPIPMERATPSSAVVADVDGDSDLEVFTGSNVLYGWHHTGQGIIDADGTERTSGDFTTLGSYYASAPTIADLDNDEILDIVAISWDTKQLFVFQPDGSIKAGFPVTLLDNVWSSPALGDVDGDGDLEIVFNSNGPRVYVFHHDGSELLDGDANPGTIGVFKTIGSSFNFGSPAVVDLDGDGKDDILIPNLTGLFFAWKFDGSDVPGFPYNAVSGGTSCPAVGDIDDDGDLEIVFTTNDGFLHVIDDSGQAEPGFPIGGHSFSGNSRGSSPALVDMDDNGDHEIIVAGTDGVIDIYNHDGSPYSIWTKVRFTEMTSGATESSPVAADLDGNGSIEILIGSEDGQLYGLDENGEPFPGFPIRLDGEIRGTPTIIDFDKSGDAQIILPGWDQNIYVWTYPGGYTDNSARFWPMLGNNQRRDGTLEELSLIDVGDAVAFFTMDPVDGGLNLKWRIPRGILADGGDWRVYRASGMPDESPAQSRRIPEGYVQLGSGSLTPDEYGWIEIADQSALPGIGYSYFIARVEGPGQDIIAFGPYGLESPLIVPDKVFVAAAYPNPSANLQSIAFGVPSGVTSGTRVKLELYNIRGARIRTLVNRLAEPGRFVATWDGADDGGVKAAGGIYLYRLIVGSEIQYGRLVRY